MTTWTDGDRFGLRRRRADPPLGEVTSTAMGAQVSARRTWIRSLRRRLLLVDVACLSLLAVVAAYAGLLTAALSALVVLAAAGVRLYDASSPRLVVGVAPLLRSTALLAGAGCVVASLVSPQPLGREIVAGAAASALIMTTTRVGLRLSWLASKHAVLSRRRLVVGDPEELTSTAPHRAALVEAGEVIQVVTRADRPGEASTPENDLRKLGDAHASSSERPHGMVERIARTAMNQGVERVTVLPGSTWQQQQLRELSWLLEGTGIDLVIATPLNGIAPHRTEVLQEDGRLSVLVASASPRGFRLLAKTLVDRLGAAVLLTLFAPLFAVISVAVRAGSPGPAVFRQTRVRVGGSTFTMYKFRTMHVDAESMLAALADQNLHAGAGPLFKMDDDPRITRAGRLLRRTSLDELPQLLNVLKGEMSLIGPRPALPDEVAKYDYSARRRLAVKPGMTGLWQVSGRSRLSWEESIGLDLHYVDNWSPAADAAIAVRTVRAVVTRDGAY